MAKFDMEIKLYRVSFETNYASNKKEFDKMFRIG